MQSNQIRPFLKWAGGKFRLIEKLAPHLQGRKLIEPFVGSGAVFLNLSFEKNLLGDINPDLINLYQHLQNEGEQFVEYSRTLFSAENNVQQKYLDLRTEFNSGVTGQRRAALFIYLNRHGFNGLCRYNKSGGFNVPFGRTLKPYFPEKEMLNFILRAKHAKFVCGDFSSLMSRARTGDVVYCDPPYVPLSLSSSFTNYSGSGFDLIKQKELAIKSAALAERGVKVIVSNHDNELTRELYKDAKIETFNVQRRISCDGANRNKAKELLAIFDAP